MARFLLFQMAKLQRNRLKNVGSIQILSFGLFFYKVIAVSRSSVPKERHRSRLTFSLNA